MKYGFLSLLALTLCAQTQPPRQLLPQVREYLQLTDAQVSGIALNNDEYNKSIQERLQRVRQVQAELAVETAKDPLDESALGVRYVEIELICRDLRDFANTLQKQNLVLLTDEQRAKLKALEEALKLIPVMIETQNSNLLGPWTIPPNGLNSNNGGVGVFLIAGNAVNGCSGTGMLTIR